MEVSGETSFPLAYVIIILLILSSSAAYRSQNAATAADPVLRAMTDELHRSVAELQFKDLDKPYFIQYIVLDQERYRASATFGAVTASDSGRARYVQAQVRVGRLRFRQFGMLTAPGFQGAPAAGITSQTVIDNDYDGIRHGLWLATDPAYKQAVEQLARKRAVVQNKVRGRPDFRFREGNPGHGGWQQAGLDIDKAAGKNRSGNGRPYSKNFPRLENRASSSRRSSRTVIW